jgi:energy-coupling factor transport system permease protein
VLQLSVSLQGVVSVNSFSVDYDKCSDLVVVGLACLQVFRIRVACVRCCEVRFFAKTGVLLRGSENFIAVNIYAVRCSPSQSDDLLAALSGDDLGFCCEIALLHIVECRNDCFLLGGQNLVDLSLRSFIVRGLKPILVLLLFTFALNIFMINGEVLWSWGFLHITREGIRTAVFMAVRLILLIIGSSMLTLCTRPLSLTDGIERLLSPFKKIGLPAHEIAMMMTIALRFIPTLLDETDKIMKAQQARGADFESGSIIQRAKNLIPILVPLFVSAFRIAQDLAMAMEARCYRGGDHRTRMHEMRLKGRDYAAFAMQAAFLAVIIIEANFAPW